MRWIIKKENQTREFESGKQCAEFIDCSYSYLTWARRHKKACKGWDIELIRTNDTKRKRFSQRELIYRMEELETKVCNLEHEVEEMRGLKNG